MSSHPSERPTWTSAGNLRTVLLGLASGGVYLAAASPRRRCALTAPFQPCRPVTQRRHGRGRCVFCGTVPRVSPGRRYRPPCPVMSGLSSKANLRDCSASRRKVAQRPASVPVHADRSDRWRADGLGDRRGVRPRGRGRDRGGGRRRRGGARAGADREVARPRRALRQALGGASAAPRRSGSRTRRRSTTSRARTRRSRRSSRTSWPSGSCSSASTRSCPTRSSSPRTRPRCRS